MFRKVRILFRTIRLNLLETGDIVFISEPVQWVIHEICKEISDKLNILNKKGVSFVTHHPMFLRNKILHFGSVGTLVKNGRIVKVHHSNKLVLSWYHVLDNDKYLAYIPELNYIVSIVHTACKITRKKLIDGGFDSDKVVIIPEHINTKLFTAVSKDRKEEIQRELGIPKNSYVVGSFQKDGCGWGEGGEPKLEKGPDVFCDVVERLAKQFPVYVLLTGPARGYVKKRLTDAGIGFTHHFLDDLSKIVNYYNALDVYLVTSREEGGPKALLESWACGTSIISTKVGMAPDIINDGLNGFLTDVDDIVKIEQKASTVLSDASLREKITKQAFLDAKAYDIDVVVPRYVEEIYGTLR